MAAMTIEQVEGGPQHISKPFLPRKASTKTLFLAATTHTGHSHPMAFVKSGPYDPVSCRVLSRLFTKEAPTGSWTLPMEIW